MACVFYFLLHWAVYKSGRVLYGLGNYVSSCQRACCDVSVRAVEFVGTFFSRSLALVGFVCTSFCLSVLCTEGQSVLQRSVGLGWPAVSLWWVVRRGM